MESITFDDNGSFLIPKFDIHLMPGMAIVRPPNNRMTWDNDSASTDRGYLLQRDGLKYPVKTHLRQMHVVNGTAKDIYMSIDGQRTARDIYLALIEKHRQPYGTLCQEISGFLKELLRRRHISVSDKPRLVDNQITGSEEYFLPPHLSVELTTLCKLRCMHCYGAFVKPRVDTLDTDRLLDVLSEFKDLGLRSIELTGGEPMLHPKFARILHWAATNMELVAILTSGTAMTEEIHEIISDHADNIVTQICINGSEAYHNEFCRSSSAYARSMTAINRLSSAGVLLRTPMNVTYDNYSQVFDTGEVVREAGSAIFMATFVNTRFGRARSLVPPTDDIDTDVEPGNQRSRLVRRYLDIMGRVQDQLDALEAHYPTFVKQGLNDNERSMREYENTCGAGRRSYYLSSNGTLCICPMSVESGAPTFGNVNRQSIKELMSSDFARSFARIPAPNEKDCVDAAGNTCPHLFADNYCILHGLLQYQETPDECPWGQKYEVDKLLSVSEDGNPSVTPTKPPRIVFHSPSSCS